MSALRTRITSPTLAASSSALLASCPDNGGAAALRGRALTGLTGPEVAALSCDDTGPDFVRDTGADWTALSSGTRIDLTSERYAESARSCMTAAGSAPLVRRARMAPGLRKSVAFWRGDSPSLARESVDAFCTGWQGVWGLMEGLREVGHLSVVVGGLDAWLRE